VIEDCAQSHGARINGKPLGTFGEIAAFSTMFGKHHCTGGQGGVVFTRSVERHRQVRRIADRGKPFEPANGFNAMAPEGTNEVASLNFNLSDLGATIGRVQLAKLAGIVERRRAFVAAVVEGIRGLASVTIPPQLPGAEPSWWWWRLEANLERLACGKDAYCQALQAEGLPIAPYYRAMPHTYAWFRERRVFGTSGLPWTSPQYRGDASRRFDCPNATRSIERHFNLTVYESWGRREIDDIVAIFRKVDAAYAR
jgi:dTDP-4-amino-4,6-dideoxygalactose transaminase